MAGIKNTTTWTAVLRGIRPIMFDRYPGDNKTQLPVADKVYLDEEGNLCLPTENLFSFLTARNTTSAPKCLLDSRSYGKVCDAFQSFVEVVPHDNIPFMRDGKPIAYGGILDGEHDVPSGVYVDRRVARAPKGIPNPKVRPVLPLPWELHISVTLYKNDLVGEATLKEMLSAGGICVGLGTYRPRYGKFVLEEWGCEQT